MNRKLVAETLSGMVNDGGGRADQVEYRVLGYTVLGTLLGVLALPAAGPSFSVFGLAFGALIGPIGMVAAARWFRRRQQRLKDGSTWPHQASAGLSIPSLKTLN